MSKLDGEQLTEIESLFEKKLSESDKFHRSLFAKIKADEIADTQFKEYIRGVVADFHQSRPRFWQKRFYTAGGVLTSFALAAALAVFGIIQKYSDLIDFRSMLHSILQTESFIIERLDVPQDVAADTTLDAALRYKLSIFATSESKDFQSVVYNLMKRRPVLVYSDRKFLSSSMSDELPFKCMNQKKQKEREIEEFNNLLQRTRSEPVPNARTVDAYYSKIKTLQSELNDFIDSCRTVVEETEVAFPFYSNFGKTAAESFDVYAVVKLLVPKLHSPSEGDELQYEPLPEEHSHSVHFLMETNTAARIGIDANNRALIETGRFVIKLDEGYWSMKAPSGFVSESEFFHIFVVQVDSEVIKIRHNVSVSVAIFLNKEGI